MTPIFRFEGIYTPVVTPYLPDGTPDRDALSDVIDFLIEAGVHGLISGGSTVTGKRFLRCSAESNAKEVVLEMGDKNPAIVMDDAENLDRVAQHIVNGAFWNMGENCSATSRLIVHRSVKDELLKRIQHHMNEWNVGNPLDPETRLDALVSAANLGKVCS